MEALGFAVYFAFLFKSHAFLASHLCSPVSYLAYDILEGVVLRWYLVVRTSYARVGYVPVHVCVLRRYPSRFT